MSFPFVFFTRHVDFLLVRAETASDSRERSPEELKWEGP